MSKSIQAEILRFLKSLATDRGEFCFHTRGEATLLSTCFGALLMQLMGAGSSFDRQAIAQTIRQYQRADGLFMDPRFRKEDLRGTHREDYIAWQFTFFAVSALDWMGVSPNARMSFVDELAYSRRAMKAWLAARNWDNFWYASNEIMFLLYFLAYRYAREMDTGSRDQALTILDELDAVQDSHTGYWGRRVRENPANGLYGAAHVLLFYDYFGREIHCAKAAVRQTLALQHPAGLFGGLHGGACEDYDAVDVLCRLRPYVVDEEVNRALDAVRDRIINAAACPGGLSYSLPHASIGGFVSRLHLGVRGQDTYQYSGWSRMASHIFRADLWSVFFRILSLAMIERVQCRPPSISWAFYSLPAWGYPCRLPRED